MLKKISVLVAVLPVLLLVPASGWSASADMMRMYGGISGGFAFENLDTDETAAKFVVAPDISFDNSWAVQARAGYVASDYLSIELMYEYVSPFESDSGGADIDLDCNNIFLNLKLTTPTWNGVSTKNLTPYATVGLGAMDVYEEIKYLGAKSKTSDWGVGLRAGLGLEYHLDSAFSIFAEGAYTVGVDYNKIDHVKYGTVNAGLNYYF